MNFQNLKIYLIENTEICSHALTQIKEKPKRGYEVLFSITALHTTALSRIVRQSTSLRLKHNRQQGITSHPIKTLKCKFDIIIYPRALIGRFVIPVACIYCV